MKSRFTAVRLGLSGSTATALVFLVGVGSAAAAPSVTSFTVSPTSAKAGATGSGHDVSIHIGLGGTSGAGNDLRDLTIHLPPGLVANPQAAPKCTVAQLNADNCPAASQVGDVANTVDAYVSVVPVEQNVTGSLYNLVAQPGEPGRFGIVLRPAGGVLPKVILQSGAALRSSDFGLDSILKNLPTKAGGLDIDIKSLDLTLYGKAGQSHNQGNFVRLPTSCGAKTFGVDITNYSNQSASGSTSLTTTNCQDLPFSPELSATIGAPGQTDIGAKPPVSSLIKQTIQESGLSQARVLLPAGVGADVTYLTTANYCEPATYNANPSSCPAASIVGNATAASPLLADPLTGTLTLIDNPSGLPQLGLDLKGALHLKLFGQLILDSSTAPIRGGVQFTVLPDIPISRFQLDFLPNRLNKLGRDVCTQPPLTFDAQFTSFGNQPFSSQPAATIEGCGAGPMPGDGKPKAKLKLSHAATKHPTARLKVTAGKSRIRKVKVTLPSKLKPSGLATLRKHAVAKAGAKVLTTAAITKEGRSISVKVGAASRGSLQLKRGALLSKHPVKSNSKLKTKIAITDVAGKTTKLTKTVSASH